MFNRSATLPIVQTEYCQLVAEIIDSGKMFLHLNLMKDVKFTPELYKDMLIDFNEVIDYVKKKGIEYLFVIIPNDEKLLKFERMFGFEVLQVLHKEDNPEEIKALVLRREV